MTIEGELCQELQRILTYAGHYDGPITGYYDERTRRALSTLIDTENLEGRFREAEGMIDKQVVALLRKELKPTGRSS
jgi:peptidoglycan hydrolase-like protein with peptidoglycan-binding domain